MQLQQDEKDRHIDRQRQRMRERERGEERRQTDEDREGDRETGFCMVSRVERSVLVADEHEARLYSILDDMNDL